MRGRDWIGILAGVLLGMILLWYLQTMTGTSEPAKVERQRMPGLVWMKGEKSNGYAGYAIRA